MGGKTSKPRTISIESDSDGVITDVIISEAVARRLQGIPDKPDEPSPQKIEPKKDLVSVPQDTSEYIRDVDPEIEDFYVQKLKELQERNETLQKHTNEQFAKAVKEVEDKFVSFTASPVCTDLQSKVMECYQVNGSDDPLKCSSLVTQFTQCVDRARVAVSASRRIQA